MSRRHTTRTALALALSAGLFGLTVAAPAEAAAKNRRQQAEWQQQQEKKREEQRETKQQRRTRQESAQQAQRAQREQRQANQQATQAQARAQRQAEWQQQRDRQVAVQQQQRERQATSRQGQREQQQDRFARQRSTVTQQPSRQAQAPNRAERRLSTQRQQELINVQRQRRASYADRLVVQHRTLVSQASSLRQQRRFAHYRYQQQYLDHLRRQQLEVQSSRYDYYRDPYFYTAPSHRYYYSGRYYDTNRYGVDLLREALNLGYREGYLAAQADLQDGWGYNYRESFAYRDANYGYDGLYIEQSQYNYYFREGFRRGYDDGYYSRFRYGYRRAGHVELIVNLIDDILRLRYLD